jgi:hypothetical protein
MPAHQHPQHRMSTGRLESLLFIRIRPTDFVLLLCQATSAACGSAWHSATARDPPGGASGAPGRRVAAGCVPPLTPEPGSCENICSSGIFVQSEARVSVLITSRQDQMLIARSRKGEH